MESDDISTLSDLLSQTSPSPESDPLAVLVQNRFLKEFSQRVLQKYYKANQRVVQLEQELNVSQVELERVTVLLRAAENELKALQSSAEFSIKEMTGEIETLKSQLFASDLKTETDREHAIHTLAQHFPLLFSLEQRFQAENESLRQQLTALTQSTAHSVKCRNCKKLFLPVNNHSTACTYHPGKLHYYSCLGCGDDAYYTCCSRCGVCSQGCRQSSHCSV